MLISAQSSSAPPGEEERDRFPSFIGSGGRLSTTRYRVPGPGGPDADEDLRVNLFHFSDTSRLPWIMSSGELRPGGNKAGGFPSPEFVWATTNPLGDASASVASGDPYITGKVRHVRFALDSGLFLPWSEIPDHYPQWTPAQVARLESYTKGASDPKTWWCCPRPIAAEHWGTIHSRSYRDNRWQMLDPATRAVEIDYEGGLRWIGVKVVGLPFVSAKVTAPDGRTGYALR